MSRHSRRSGTKSKVIPGKGENKPPQYRYSQGTYYHRRNGNKKAA